MKLRVQEFKSHVLECHLSLAFSWTELSFGELFACPFRVPPISLEHSFFSVVAILHKCIYINKSKTKLRTKAFVPFFNTLFKTSVIYVLWLHVRFGQKAGNYELVIAAARHYWNAIKPFIVEPIERELLREPMEAVLECIAAVAANEVGKEDEVRRKCL